ncbi:MAG: 6-hydroxymethylpterin diphosphokinase MptE-like protein [Planctomycetota bacterium]
MTLQSPPAIGNEMFVHNMRALWRHDPWLALRVDAVNDEERIPLEPTRSGAWTAKMSTSRSSAIYLHSRVDPVTEARRAAAAVDAKDTFCFVVSGMGLGYLVAALLDALRSEAIVVCTEPSIPLLATALTCTDLTDAISSRRLLILTDGEKTRLHDLLRPCNTLMMLGSRFIRHAPSMQIAEAEHKPILQALTDFIAYTRMSLLTLVGNSQITCRNIAMNMPHYVTTPPIDMLKGRFEGNPAIIISAGPSLSRNIHLLAELKGRAVLCAVQTALKPLLQRGIVPDFVTTLDFHEVSKQFFEQAGDLSRIRLVAEPKATWHVLDHYPGPVSVLGNGWAQMILGDVLGQRAGLRAGATVAHLAFYLAEYLGCNPIIFVGQDLAFTGHVFYVPGVEIHRTWRGELNRFNTMEQKEWDRIARNRPILRRVPAADGSADLYTDELLFTYLEQFEKDIGAMPARVINATQGGAHIRGTTTMTLHEAAEQLCEKPIDPRRFQAPNGFAERDDSRIQPACAEIRQRLAELDEATNVCDELLKLLDELTGLTQDPTKFNQRLIRVDELRAKVAQDSRAYQIVNAYTQLAELRRYSADRKIGTAETNDAERAKRQLARDKEFITAVRDGAKEIQPLLVEAIERLEEFDRRHNEKIRLRA